MKRRNKAVKFLVIGDPHGSRKLLKLDLRGYDAAIITGDMGRSDVMRKLAWGRLKGTKGNVREMYSEYVGSALPVLRHLSGIPCFCVKGNAEVQDSDIREANRKYGFKIPLFEQEAAKMKNIVFLEHAVAKFKGVTIAGIGHFLETKWVEEFSDGTMEKMILAAIEEELARIFFSSIGRVDILVSHQPPYGILDRIGPAHAPPKGWKGKHAGSRQLLEYIEKSHPSYVVCGHIHEGKGIKKVGKTTVINAGCCGAWRALVVKK